MTGEMTQTARLYKNATTGYNKRYCIIAMPGFILTSSINAFKKLQKFSSVFFDKQAAPSRPASNNIRRLPFT
jgi:hypothetical protein